MAHYIYDFSTHTHTAHTHTHATHTFCDLNISMPRDPATHEATSYDVWNRCVLTLLLNEETESEERTERGREFQVVGAE